MEQRATLTPVHFDVSSCDFDRAHPNMARLQEGLYCRKDIRRCVTEHITGVTRAAFTKIMVSFRYAVLLATLSTVFSLRCYTQSTANNYKPTISIECPGSRYCEKKSARSGDKKANVYYCGSDAECSKAGCTTSNKVTTCCCTGNLCNASSKLSAFLTILPIGVAKLIY